MMNAMLVSSGAPLNLWGEAILSVCHIQNRIPYNRHFILDKLIEANGSKPLPITIKPSDGKQKRKYCEKLSNEFGLTVRQHAPVRVEKWKQMS